ncbi:MAG: glutamine--fructose-6-phosphate transaminase (isomerizing), partial [Methylocystaceae bacterium]
MTGLSVIRLTGVDEEKGVSKVSADALPVCQYRKLFLKTASNDRTEGKAVAIKGGCLDLCGIMGYVGDRQAVPIIYDGLACLEYRGYDSAGIAIQNGDGIWLAKKKGRLANLDQELEQAPPSTAGIGHTRWATHGVPSDHNSHPHLDCSGKIALLHNGIVENFGPLKAELISRGHTFKSETDTEVLVHLIEEQYHGVDLEEAVRRAMARVEGAYAIAVISSREPGVIVAARQTSPLVIGLGEGENYLASDIPALLPHTRQVYILNDFEMAVLTKSGVRVTDFQGKIINKEIFQVTWDAVAAEKGGYEHFMLKEIFEQPQAIRETLRGRIHDDKVDFDDPELKKLVRGVDKVFITACGTAYHAGVVGKLAIERLAQVPVEIDVASEFRYRDVLWGKNTMLIVVSQSGETADTLAALREAKRQGVKVLAVTNVVGSSVAREADHVIYTLAGPEIAVAS